MHHYNHKKKLRSKIDISMLGLGSLASDDGLNLSALKWLVGRKRINDEPPSLPLTVLYL